MELVAAGGTGSTLDVLGCKLCSVGMARTELGGCSPTVNPAGGSALSVVSVLL